VLDLARLAAHSHARGESGALDHLACFFKDPYGVEVHDFHAQFDLLHAYVRGQSTRPSLVTGA
jgi:myo-inositol-1-phosphate synthase